MKITSILYRFLEKYQHSNIAAHFEIQVPGLGTGMVKPGCNMPIAHVPY